VATFVYHRALLKALFYRYNLNLLAFSDPLAEREGFEPPLVFNLACLPKRYARGDVD
jgi:hypothetical protein